MSFIKNNCFSLQTIFFTFNDSYCIALRSAIIGFIKTHKSKSCNKILKIWQRNKHIFFPFSFWFDRNIRFVLGYFFTTELKYWQFFSYLSGIVPNDLKSVGCIICKNPLIWKRSGGYSDRVIGPMRSPHQWEYLFRSVMCPPVSNKYANFKSDL